MKVRELRGWPPDSFVRVGHGQTPTHSEQATIGDVLNVFADCVRFSCGIGNETVACSFFVSDVDTANKFAAILKTHKDENLLSIGETEIPA